jgi:hypothetical protein
VRTVFLVLGIWLLINVIFVLVTAPELKQGTRRSPQFSGTSKEAYPFDGEERTSLRFIIISITMGALFSLSPPMADAAAAITRSFKRTPAE